MEAKELMIGDWVCTDNCEAIKVRMVNDYGDVVLDWDDDRMSPVNNIKEIKPIPLTSEILEKNGFIRELDKDGIHYRYTLIYENIKFSLKYVRSVFQWLGPLDFRYVHELQHALKLCGIDKTIII